MLSRNKEEILIDFDEACRRGDRNKKRRLEFEVNIDIRNNLETLCCIQRKSLTQQEELVKGKNKQNKLKEDELSLFDATGILPENEDKLGIERGDNLP